MKIEIVESHKQWKESRKERLMQFFEVAKNVIEEEAEAQVNFMDWYKKEFCSLCFEAIAWDKGYPVGYMRCYNDPAKKERWFVGDIHVIEAYRRRGIASKLYDEVIEELLSYENAECLEACIKKTNEASIALHKAIGFKSTGKLKKFANFYFEQDEVFYKFDLLQVYPVLNKDYAEETLQPLWDLFQKKNADKSESVFVKMTLNEFIHRAVDNGEFTIETVWCGNKLKGLIADGDLLIFNTF